MKPYFIYIDGQQVGPVNLEELKEKKITRETLVWQEGNAEWKQADTFKELQEILSAVPPPINESVISPPPIVETPKLTYSQESKPAQNKTKRVVVMICLGILIIAGISAFVSYQNDQALREWKIEMRIAEQDRKIREQRIAEINKELADSYQTLDKAKAQLNDATAFKLLRTSDERHQQIVEAEKVVKSWEGHIANLEAELKKLQTEQ